MSKKIPLSVDRRYSVEEITAVSKDIVITAGELAAHGLTTTSADLGSNYYGLPVITLNSVASISYIPTSVRRNIENRIQAKINKHNVITADLNKEDHYFTTIFPV